MEQIHLNYQAPTVLDAAGNVPVGKTLYEQRYANIVASGEMLRRFKALAALRDLPLAEKIAMANSRIREWYEAFDGQVAVSFSGGKDSSVLLHLARTMYPDIPAVSVNTGLEYPEIVRLVKSTPNTVILRPKMPFHRVISVYGWPLVSKKVALGISVLRNPTGRNKNIVRLYESGINRFNQRVNGFRVPDRWKFLVTAPFNCSDKCCAVMKKEPIRRYARESGRVMMVGTRATDSKMRERAYLLAGGCNVFDAKTPKSTPLGPWTEQDVLAYIRAHQVPVASVYGALREKDDGRLEFSGVKGTGCVFCCFGLHLDGPRNRFIKLRETHPKLWDYCINKLGLGEVLAYMRAHCPDKRMKQCFLPQAPAISQGNLWAQGDEDV
ncbi:phosphoadenosine phosphosulfate reductase family protein [Desulfobulbus elongatus]|uniref:phosphoadenosine phosphosulfate reductase family protein n=1 Tax=Desulfobulbus elongatus TaxID=53332 RepID=UPI000B1EA9BF|nr:phosphoadenosine phosphosulfate reductase family protein [Desulfobulbus elongatus]